MVHANLRLRNIPFRHDYYVYITDRITGDNGLPDEYYVRLEYRLLLCVWFRFRFNDLVSIACRDDGMS